MKTIQYGDEVIAVEDLTDEQQAMLQEIQTMQEIAQEASERAQAYAYLAKERTMDFTKSMQETKDESGE